jgi:uncharacterized membrane protein
MTISGDAQQKIDAYLNQLRARLRGASDDEVQEIVDELRSHILDKAAIDEKSNREITGDAIDAAIARLGSPEELASQYMTDALLARAEVSRSPIQLLRSLFRWASLSVAGFFVLLGSLVGYCFGIVLVLVALSKLFHPHTAGLWSIPSGADDFQVSFRLGFGGIPASSRDLLGWWIVPIGWVGGGALVMLTTQIAVWFARKYRRALTLP